VKGHGPSGRTDFDDLMGILESIAEDGKIYLQWSDTDSTVELVAFCTASMLTLYMNFPEMLFMDGRLQALLILVCCFFYVHRGVYCLLVAMFFNAYMHLGKLRMA